MWTNLRCFAAQITPSWTPNEVKHLGSVLVFLVEILSRPSNPLPKLVIWDICGPSMEKIWDILWSIYGISMALIWAIAFHIKPILGHCFFLGDILLSSPMGFFDKYYFRKVPYILHMICVGTAWDYPIAKPYDPILCIWDFYIFCKVP